MLSFPMISIGRKFMAWQACKNSYGVRIFMLISVDFFSFKGYTHFAPNCSVVRGYGWKFAADIDGGPEGADAEGEVNENPVGAAGWLSVINKFAGSLGAPKSDPPPAIDVRSPNKPPPACMAGAGAAAGCIIQVHFVDLRVDVELVARFQPAWSQDAD